MAKIENTVVYPIKTNVSTRDYVVITDVEDGNATKSAYIGDICTACGGDDDVAIRTQTLSVDAATLAALPTTPIQLIAPPGANKFIMPLQILMKMSGGTIAYDFNPTDSFAVQLSAGGTFVNRIFYGAVFNVTAGTASYFTGESPGDQYDESYGNPNSSLVLFGTGAALPTQGDGTLKIVINYTVVEITGV